VDFADRRFRQARVLNSLPRLAPVARGIDRAAGSAAQLGPGVHLDLPHSRKQDVRILWIHRQARAAGVRIREEHTVPMLPAVGRLVDAALLLRTGEAS